jgi:hypothetical protein
MAPKSNTEPAPRTPAPARKLDPHRTLTPLEEEIILRLLASAMGLPRICVFKACRRTKFCHGPSMVCAGHHRGLVRKRMRAAIALITKRK